MRPSRWVIALLLLFVPLASTAQTVSTGFCIAGTSTAVTYAWWIDLSCDSANQSSEPNELTAGPVFPNGAPATSLASDFASSITANSVSASSGISAAASGGCFNILQAPKICVGGTNAGAPCTTSAQCPGGGVCQTTLVCAGGPNAGASCTTNANCPASTCIARPFCLMVGTTSPTCQVTTSGCSYNPVITLTPPTPVPALGPGPLVAVVLLIAVGVIWLAMRRRNDESFSTRPEIG